MIKEEIIIGMGVTYYDVITDDGQKLHPFETKIASKVYDIGGECCCRIVGRGGLKSISRLEPRAEDCPHYAMMWNGDLWLCQNCGFSQTQEDIEFGRQLITEKQNEPLPAVKEAEFKPTRRDYFAGIALQAILSNETLRVACMDDSSLYGVNRLEAPANEAVRQADILIAELEKTKGAKEWGADNTYPKNL